MSIHKGARLSVNINDETAAYLKEQSKAQGVTVTEVVRRCVALDHLLRNERDGGSTILVKSGAKVGVLEDPTFRELVIL